MIKRALSRYLGLVFIAVVILPAVVLGLLAIRSISREEIYIQTQLERTLSAEIDHAAGLVGSEIDLVRQEIAEAARDIAVDDPAGSFAAWKTRSPLVDTPFLLSPDYEILWPGVGPDAAAAEPGFLEKQQAFLRDEVEVPIYENVAAAYKDDILGERSSSGEGGEAGEARPERPSLHQRGGRSGETRFMVDSLDLPAAGEQQPGEGTSTDRDQVYGEESKRQAATSLFLQSQPAREMAYKKAEEQGQQISYRNVQPTAPAAEEADKIAVVGRPQESSRPPAAEEARISASEQQLEPLDKGAPEDAEVPAQAERRPAPPRPDRGSAEEARRLKSIFVSQPLRLSEIVAGGGNGIVPLAVDGGLRLLYWQRETEGNVIGCLVAAGQLRDRIVGSIPNIYSASRILTVLDEKGQPLFVPAGQEGRDWRKPFVAREISEILPGWEAAAYLADPEVISARARVTTSLTWLLIFIMFASIVAGGVLVLRSASAELKLAQQKTTFVANVSHELKTPLTSIRMFAEMLRDGRQSDERKRQQYFSIMTAETERLTRLINNVLDFARSEQGKKRYTMRECDLAGLAASIVESQRARWENNGFKVVFTAGSDPVVVSADEEALKQAVINLLSNAEKYSDQVKEIEVTVGEECGSAVVGVSDRGIGIPTGEAERIFSEFYRVDDALTARVKGTGLGLTIARRIARDHGGDVVHSARPGGGSTFRIVLPLRAERQ